MSVLSGTQIEARLNWGEIIVNRGNTKLRGAAVDLRLAPEFMILPDGTRIWPGHSDSWMHRRRALTLNPGDVAFVSTVERIRMPWDLAGNIAVRFRMEERGIAVQGGLLVDPGYGQNDPEGERLHFQLANVSSKPVTVAADEPIAALQILAVEGDAAAAVGGKAASTKDKIEDLFYPGAEGRLAQLSFFPEMRQTQEDLKELSAKIDEQRRALAEVEKATDRLVVFGVFVIAATIFAVAVADILSAFLELGQSEDGPDWTVVAISIGGLAALLLAPMYAQVLRTWNSRD